MSIFRMEDENAGDAGNLSSVLVVGVLAYGMNEPAPYEGPAEEILKEIFSGRLQVTIHKVESKGSARKK